MGELDLSGEGRRDYLKEAPRLSWEFPKIGEPRVPLKKGFLKGVYKGSIKGLGFREFHKIGDPNIVP